MDEFVGVSCVSDRCVVTTDTETSDDVRAGPSESMESYESHGALVYSTAKID